MNGAGRYAELAAAVRSFKAELIRPDQIERLVEAGSFSETVTMLTAGKVTAVDGAEISSVEAYLVHRVIELAERLTSYTPYDSKPLIRLISRSYELECVKEILRALEDKVSSEETLRHIVPAGRFTTELCKELIEAGNPTRVIEAIQDESLRRHLASKLAGERSGVSVVSAVDQYYYQRLWAASNLPDPLDTQSARSLIGELVDQMNILLAIRARTLDLDSKATCETLLPVNYALGHVLSELAESTNIQNLIRAVEKTPYARAFEGRVGLNGGVARIERSLQRNHATSCLNAFAGSPFNIGLAVAFLFLKNYELRDLYTIVNGKANNIPAERIYDSLILR